MSPAPGRASPGSIAAALAGAQAAGLDRTDAHLLLGHVLGRDRGWLIAHDGDALGADELQRFQALLLRRQAGEPVAYLRGRQAFHGLDLDVAPGVLVPRPDTETLVDWALDLLGCGGAGRPRPEPQRLLDLGTGSGAIALAVARAAPHADVTATDRSATALAVARANGQRLGLRVTWCAGDWFGALPAHTAPFDLVLSNPPYIAEADPHLAALRHEPIEALTPGGDGLGALRQIVGAAAAHLVPGGWLLLEHGWDQAPAVRAMLQQAGFAAVQTRTDLAGQPRCSGGRRP